MTSKDQTDASSTEQLVAILFDAGLIQFGAFTRDGIRESFLLRLDMLISYPEVLRAAATSIAKLIEPERINRLVCTHDSVALGTLVSQSLNMPLVAHSGALGHPAANFVGAYDVGHPAALISLTSTIPMSFVTRLRNDAATVGLNLITWVTLVQVSPVRELDHVAAVDIHRAAKQLARQGKIGERIAERIVG